MANSHTLDGILIPSRQPSVGGACSRVSGTIHMGWNRWQPGWL